MKCKPLSVNWGLDRFCQHFAALTTKLNVVTKKAEYILIKDWQSVCRIYK
jgi:hypothetical protein